MGFGTRPHGLKETIADFHALDGLDSHDRAGKSRIQAAIGLHIGADACGNAVHHDFNHPAQGIGIVFGLVDAGDHSFLGRLVKRTYR